MDQEEQVPKLLPPPGRDDLGEAGPGDGLPSEIERLRETVADLRKKVARDRETIKLWREFQPKFTEFLLDILEVQDNFERAETAARGGGRLDAVAEGLTAVRRQLLGVLERREVMPFGEAGAEFHPELHTVLEGPGVEPEGALRVAEILRPGYRIGGEVLRKAWVRIE